MGCFKAYDEDNKEKEFTTLDYYKQIIKDSLLLEEDSIKESTSEQFSEKFSETWKKINDNDKEHLESFWGKLEGTRKDISFCKIDKKGKDFNQLIDQLTDKELSYLWEAEGKKEYKIISIFNIYQQFFVKYSDNSTKVTRSNPKSDFLWNIDKNNLKDNNHPPEIFPPIFLFDTKDSFYILIKSDAQLLYFNIKDKSTTKHKYYYCKDGENFTYESSLKIKTTKSSGGYIGRPDSMDEFDYRWSIKNDLNDEYKSVANLLAFDIGLDKEKEKNITNDDNEYKETIKDKEVIFYKTNTPTTYGNLKNKPDLITFFNFYKVLKKDVVKKNFPKDNIRKPLVFDNTIAKAKKDKDNIEIENNYVVDSHKILYKSKNKRKEISTNPKERESTGKVMGNSLKDFSFFTPLENIEYDEKDISPNKTKLTDTNYSATSFAQYVLYKDEISNETWENLYFKENNTYENTKKESILKNDKIISKVDTDQEWCHLLGHADGGADEFGNLVSGSKHCNTEQLSMEIGQSRFIKDTSKNINANITAYLIKSNLITKDTEYSKEDLQGKLKDEFFNELMAKDVFKKLFKETNNGYKIEESNNYENDLNEIYYILKKEIDRLVGKIEFPESIEEKSEKKDIEKFKKDIVNIKVFKENLCKNFFEVLPLAQSMRYKHYYEGKKVFDHIFDAQNESICSLECKILDYTLEMNLYIGTDDWDGYKKVLENRVKKKLPSDKTLKEYKNIISYSSDHKVATLNQKRKSIKSIDGDTKKMDAIKKKVKENTNENGLDNNELNKEKEAINQRDLSNKMEEETK